MIKNKDILKFGRNKPTVTTVDPLDINVLVTPVTTQPVESDAFDIREYLRNKHKRPLATNTPQVELQRPLATNTSGVFDTISGTIKKGASASLDNLKLLNDAVGTGTKALLGAAAFVPVALYDMVSSGETGQILNLIGEKKLKINVSKAQADIVENEGRQLPLINQVIDYEHTIQYYNMLLNTAKQLEDLMYGGDVSVLDLYQKTQTDLRAAEDYLSKGKQSYENNILQNKELRELYYKTNAEDYPDPKEHQYDNDYNNHLSKYIKDGSLNGLDKLMLNLSLMFNFDTSVSDDIETGVKTGILNKDNLSLKRQPDADNADRQFIINKALNLLPAKEEAVAIKLLEVLSIQKKLREGTWYYDPKAITPEFRKQVENNTLNFSDPLSIKLALPHIGSSLSEVQAMVGSITAAGAAKMLAKKFPGAGTAIMVAEAAFNVGFTMYLRDAETSSEVFDSYLSRILESVQLLNIDLGKVLQNGAELLLTKYGVDVTDKSDLEVLNEMLVYNVQTDNKAFELIKADSYKGLGLIRAGNMALGAVDVLQNSVFSYGGKLAAKAAFGGAAKAIKASKIGKSASAAETLIGDHFNNTMLKIAKTSASANKLKHVVTGVGSMAGKAGFIMASEATEEGQQFLLTDEYKKGEYDKYNNSDNNYLNGLVRNQRLGFEANLALLGLHSDDALVNNKELELSMKVGALIGGLMGGVGSTIADSYSMMQQYKADNLTKQIVANDIANKEEDIKIDLYFNAAKSNKFDYLKKSLEDIRDNFLPEGLTKDDLDADIKRAGYVQNFYNSKSLDKNLELLNIKKGSEDHATIAKYAIKTTELEDKSRVALNDAFTRLTSLILDAESNPVYKSMVEQLMQFFKQDAEVTTDNLSTAFTQVGSMESRVKALTELLKLLKNRAKFIEAANKHDNLDLDIALVHAITANVDAELLESKKILANIKLEYGIRRGIGFENAIEIEAAFKEASILKALHSKNLTRLQAYHFGAVFNFDPKRDIGLKIWSDLTEDEKTAEMRKAEDIANEKSAELPTPRLVAALYNVRVTKESEVKQDPKSAPKLWNTLTKLEQDRLTLEAGDDAIIAGRIVPTTAEVSKAFNKLALEEAYRSGKLNDFARRAATKIILNDIARYKVNDQSYNDDTSVTVEETPAIEPTVATEPELVPFQGLSEEMVVPPEEFSEETIPQPTEVPVDEPDLNGLPNETVEAPVDETGDSASNPELKRFELVEAEDKARQLEQQEQPQRRTSLYEEPQDKTGALVETDSTPLETATSEELGDDKITEEDAKTPSILTDALGAWAPSMFGEASGETDVDAQVGESTADIHEPTADVLLLADELTAGPEVELTVADPEIPARDKVVLPVTGDQVGVNRNGNITIDGVAVPESLLALAELEATVIETEADDLLTKSLKSNIVSGITGSGSPARSGLVGKTLFYNPFFTDAMVPPFTIPGATTIESSNELGKFLALPDALDGATMYFAVGQYGQNPKVRFDPMDVSTNDVADIYMIIQKDGKTYVTGIRKKDEALVAYSKAGRKYTTPEAIADIQALVERRNLIIKEYFSLVPEVNGVKAIPTTALTHVLPTRLNRTNGVYNTQKDIHNQPIFRPLASVTTFAVPEDPYAVLDELLIGYGTGVMSLTPKEIINIQTLERLSETGGWSGKLFLFPKIENTPSGRYTAPVMLTEKNFKDASITKPSDIKLKSEGVPMGFPEFVYSILVGRISDDFGVLDLMLNNGERTKVSKKVAAKAPFLAKKQLHYNLDEDILYLGGISPSTGDMGTFSYHVSEIEKTPALKKAIIFHLMLNFHWNTDKDIMLSPISSAIRDAAMKHDSDNVVIFKGQLEFSAKQLGLERVDGKLLKIQEDAPSVLSWLISSLKLITDVGDTAFKDPFLYVEDFTTVESKPIDAPKVNVPVTPEPAKLPVGRKGAANTGRMIDIYNKLGKADATQPKSFRILTKEEAKELGMTPTRNVVLYYRENGDVAVMNKPSGVFSTSENELSSKLVNITAARQWLTEKLGLSKDLIFITDAIMRMSGRNDVYGVTRMSAKTLLGEIGLSSRAAEGIEYHEAWHYVNLLIHSPRERQVLHNEFLTAHPEYVGSTPQEIEEYMAEDFRHYMFVLTKTRYIIQKAFGKIKDFLQNVFGKGDSIIHSVHKRIKNGAYAGVELDAASVAEFELAYSDNGVFFSIPGLSEEDQARIPNITDPGVYYDVVDSLSRAAISLFGIRSQEDIANLSSNFKMLLSLLQSSLDEGTIPEGNELIAKDVVNNYDLFHSAVVDNLRLLSIVEVQTLDEEADVAAAVETGEKSPSEIFDRVSYEFSKKNNVAFNAKLYFYSVPKEEYVWVTDEDGTQRRTLQPVCDSIFGMETTVPFDVCWNKILENLWMVETYDDILSVCKVKAESDPFFLSLYDSLTGDSKPDENTETLILSTVKSAKHDMMTLKFEDAITSKPDANGDHSAIAGNWSVMSSENLRLINKYPRDWSLLFYTSGIVDTSVPGNTKINKLAYEAVLKKFNKIKSDVDIAGTSFTSSKSKLKGKFSSQDIEDLAKSAKQQLVEVLNTLGIGIDSEALNYLLYSESSSSGVPTEAQFDKLYHLLTSREIGNITSNIFGNITALINNTKGKNTKTVNYTNVFVSSPKAFIGRLAVAYGKTHPNPAEFSMTGPNNTTIYPISENNYMFDRVRQLNLSTSEVNTALETPYNLSSIVLNALKNSGKVKLRTFLAVENASTGSSRGYFDLSPLEDYTCKMLFTHSDRMTLPTMADKKTWYTIEGVPLHHDLVSRTVKRDVINEDGTIGIEYTQDETQLRLFSKLTLDTFYNYLISEFNAVSDYYSNREMVAKNPAMRVDNYHGKIVNGRMAPGGNGGMFRYFSSLKLKNNDGTSKYFHLNLWLLSAEKLEYSTKKDGAVKARLEAIKTRLFSEENRAEVYAAINATLTDRVTSEINLMASLGLISITPDRKLINKFIPQNIVADYIEKSKGLPKGNPDKGNTLTALYSIIANHVANTIISINEVEKVFTGDPAYYKWLRDKNGIITDRWTDKIKRLGPVLSTGSNLRTYWGDGDPRNDTKINVMHLADNNIVLPLYAMLVDMFKLTALQRKLLKDGYTSKEVLAIDLQEMYDDLSAADKKEIDNIALRLASGYNVRTDGSGNINLGDAAVYIRPELYKRIILATGNWSEPVAKAYELLESGLKWLSDPALYQLSLETLIKPLKMIYFGNHREELLNLSIPVCDKMAIFPMFKVLATADNKALYDRMNNEELGVIDMITFESAVKVGGRKKFVSYNDAANTEFNFDMLNLKSTNGKLDPTGKLLPTYIQDLRNLRLQLNTDPHESVDRSFGTQVAKIALSNIVKDMVYGKNKGVEVTGRQILLNVMASIERLSDIGYSEFANEFFNEDDTVNNKALSNFLKALAMSSGLSTEMISAFGLDDGEFVAPLSALSSRKFVESRVIVLAGRKMIDINTPGGTAIQMSFYGFKNTKPKEQSEIGRAFNNGDELNFINKDGSMDIMLSTNFFRSVVPAEFQSDYETMRDWLFKNNIIGKDAKPFAIGYRVPTQGLSSTFSMKVMDVLPESLGDVLIVPDGFTALTGSDFDIDKIFLATRHYKNGVPYKFDESKGYNGNSKKAVINHMLDMYELAISDDTNLDLSRAPLDSLTDIMKKEILPLIKPSSTLEAAPFQELSPAFLQAKKDEFTEGKSGISPFALHAPNHALTLATNLQMNYGKIGDLYNLGLIDAIYGQDGYPIMAWLSAMIDAHVDVAKDPYIIALNINETTYRMACLLLRAGKGTNALYFLPLPILREYTAELKKLNGEYGNVPNNNPYQQEKDLIKSLYAKYTALALKYVQSETDLDLKNNYSSLLSNWSAYFLGRKQTVELIPNLGLAFNKETLLDGLSYNSTEKLKNFRFFYNQLLMLRAYESVNETANTLASLVLLSQIDTKKYGNNLTLVDNFNAKVNDFIDSHRSDFLMLSENGVDYVDNALVSYYELTFLGDKLDKIHLVPKALLKDHLVVATDEFNTINKYVTGSIFGKTIKQDTITGQLRIKSKSNGSRESILQIADAVDSYIRARFQDSPRFGLTDDLVYDMFYGDTEPDGIKSMASRLLTLRTMILNDVEKYSDLVDAYGHISNEFLTYLVTIPATNRDVVGTPDRVILSSSSMANSSNYENRLQAYFGALLDSKHPEVREFAEDLAKYAYITSYDNKSHNTFFHLVPLSWKIANGYTDSIRNTISILNDPLETIALPIDDVEFVSYPSVSIAVARNNWMNDELVPTVPLPKASDVVHSGRTLPFSESNIFPKGVAYVAAFTTKLHAKSDFVKVMYGASPKIPVLYVKVGTVKAFKDGEAAPLPGSVKNVYIAIPKLGLRYGGTTTYEYSKAYDERSAFGENDIAAINTDSLIDFYNDHNQNKISLNNWKLPFNQIVTRFQANEYLDTSLSFETKRDPLLLQNGLGVSNKTESSKLKGVVGDSSFETIVSEKLSVMNNTGKPTAAMWSTDMFGDASGDVDVVIEDETNITSEYTIEKEDDPSNNC